VNAGEDALRYGPLAERRERLGVAREEIARPLVTEID
jgi:hypothetical protein